VLKIACCAVICYSAVRASVFRVIMNRLTGSTAVWIPSPTVFAPRMESDSRVFEYGAVVDVCRAFIDRHPEPDTV